MISKGLKIDSYIIQEELGRGGFGSVYLAIDEGSGMAVAVKFLHPKNFRDQSARQGFIDEMINQARLSSCPNIVSVLRSVRYTDRQGEHLGMMMEYVEGEPLDMFIEKNGLLPDFLAVPIMYQALNGLAFAHGQGMLHRDIKPGNIMVGSNGLVKLMDFGLAKTMETSTSGASESARAASLNYVSPERLARMKIDVRTDIYSLGCSFYEALTGRPPYEIEPGNWSEAQSKHNSGGFKDIRVFYPEHSEALQNLVAMMLQPDRSKRASDCGVLLEGMKPLLDCLHVPEGASTQHLQILEAARAIVAGNRDLSRFQVAIPSIRPVVENGAAPARPESQRLSRVEKLTETGGGIESIWVEPDASSAVPTGSSTRGDVGRVSQPEVSRSVPPPRTPFSETAQKADWKYRRVKPAWVLAGALVLLLGILGIKLVKDAGARAEKEAWTLASRAETISAYDGYLQKYPEGDYAARARSQQNSLRERAELSRLRQQADDQERRARERAEKERFAQEKAERERLAREADSRSSTPTSSNSTTMPSSSLGIEWVKVEAGEFMMGSNDGWDEEKPVHRVYLDTYYISKYEVTFDQYDSFCEATGREKPDDKSFGSFGRGHFPALNVTWHDANAFCSWLSKKESRIIRLPTEAEWEKAAKGGNFSRGYVYSGSNNFNLVAWCDSGRTHPVGQKKANELGLYDMSGNVWEWCLDWFDEGYYERSPSRNPKGPAEGWARVLRGGGVQFPEFFCRSSHRNRSGPSSRFWDNPSEVSGFQGFRPVMEIEKDRGDMNRQRKNSVFRVINVRSDDMLNMRAEPDYNAELVEKIPYDAQSVEFLDERVFVKAKQKGFYWYKVKYNGKEGWVNSHFLELVN
ncbi:MAG: SUMF1/EgtB/PvdO family nonheme iron enzyme [Acidobacteriota bacterium]|jgi:formylglycine-generating enzyme required for sulfatase activity/serine/threonine protein kinase|nr:SUMF1/EgtB/PvdO family nonheme iron enzyme [Acidobacteriota bacterium]